MAFEVNAVGGRMDSLVDRKYDEYLDSFTGTQRVASTCALFDSVVAMLRRDIARDSPGLDERELALRVAEILYLSYPGMRGPIVSKEDTLLSKLLELQEAQKAQDRQEMIR